MTAGSPFTIALALPQHLAALPQIELRAATMLRGHAPAAVLESSTAVSDFREAQENGRLWIAILDGEPAGFALVIMLDDGLPHLHELDVLPEHGRRGMGRALVHAVLEWTRAAGHADITLSTFRDVPWNMPFYLTCGFSVVPPAHISQPLAGLAQHDAERGMDPGKRVIMRYVPGTT